MDTLSVFYGDIVRDNTSGVDVSCCDSMQVVVRDMVNTLFADVRKSIRRQFSPTMRGMKMIVEAFICVGRNDGTVARWGLREMKNETHWRKYMGYATTPGSAMYGQPMVYVQFISASDEAECSSGAGEVELAMTAAPSTGPSEPAGGHHVAQVVVDPGYWSAVVDQSEHMEGMSEALDHDGDDHSSSSSSSNEEGGGTSRRAVAALMDPQFLQTMRIGDEFHSVPGLGEASLQVGQTFPDKASADQAIKRYALGISRQYRVKQQIVIN